MQIRSKFPFGTITLRLKEMVFPPRRPPRPLSVRYREADLSRVTDGPRRGPAEQGGSLAPRVPPGADRSFAAFLASLPDVLAARDLRAVIAGVAAAARGPTRRNPAASAGT